ncbi:MAG: hypothetical protein ACLQVF_28765 [Isosphaeraceae bacterium]
MPYKRERLTPFTAPIVNLALLLPWLISGLTIGNGLEGLPHPCTSGEPGQRAPARRQAERNTVPPAACMNNKENVMIRPFLIAAGIGALLGTTIGWAADTGPDGSSPALDLRSHEAQSAQVDSLRGAAGGIRVTFHPADWPSVHFPAPRGRAWDWSSQGSLLLALRNPDQHEIELGIRIDDDPAADGKIHCRTAQVTLKALESATVAVALSRIDPMAHGMRGLPARPGTRDATAFGSGPFDLRHVVEFQIFVHQPRTSRRLDVKSARLAPALSLDGIVDPLGQYARADWPGKVQSESDLVRRHELEAADIKAHPAPPDRDRFGGWGAVPRQPATGFFRTARLAGKWWLVDPDGGLFISLGVDCVTPDTATILSGRESMFASLPRPGAALARYFGTARSVHSGPVKEGKTFNFYAANLERAYGPNSFDRWRQTALDRLKSWGFNTVGNWSDHRFYRNGQIPYVATVWIHGDHARVGSGSDYWGKMHDPFDPRFAESVKNSLRGVVVQVQGDPWCLGYFVDNELSWGGSGDEGGRYGLGLGALDLPKASAPAKRAILEQLKKKHGEISHLNAAWNSSFSDWQALDSPWRPASSHSAWSAEFKADLAAFVKELARTYFKTVRDQLKAADSDHLYLGCRFAWRTDEAVAAAAEFCDVVSFNIYDRRVDPGKWGFLTNLGRPAIIGEFHAGALDRGMFHPGLVRAADQKERAAIYTDFVASVLENPALVGCHWFQFVDEPLTGRSYDGENYNIGFLSVTDTPYPELVAAARAIHRHAYARRAGKPD